MNHTIDIQNYTEQPTYKRGLDLYKRGHVQEYFEKKQGDEKEVGAVVLGSKDGFYDARLLIDEEHGILAGIYCDCQAFHRYNSVCKHCVALTLLYNERHGDNRPQKKQTSPELRALFQKEALQKSLPVMQNDTYGKVRLEPIFWLDNYGFHVEFKIGVTKMYVLKDVKELEERIRNGEDYAYGKYFHFYHTLQAFDERWRPMAEFLCRWAREYRRQNSRMSYHGYMIDYSEKVRNMVLSGEELADFLQAAGEEKLTGTIPGTRTTVWQVTREPLPRTMTIQGDEEGITLKTSKCTAGGEAGKYRVYFHEGRIYLEDKEKLAPILGFLNSMTAMGDRDGYIEKADLPVFCRDYLPVLKDFYRCRMRKFDPEEYKMESPKLRVYLDAPQTNMVTERPVALIEDRELPLYGTEELAVRDMQEEGEIKEILGKYSNAYDAAHESMVIADDPDLLYEFLTEGIPLLQSRAEVYISDALKRFEVRKAPKMSVGVSLEGNLLELKLTAGDLSREELIDILSRYQKKKKYYRLKDGSFVDAGDSGLDTVAELRDSLGITDRQLRQEQVEVPKYRALYLDHQLKEDPSVSSWKNKAFRSLIRNMKTVDDNDFEVPGTLEGVLREYQKRGFLWLKTLEHNGFGGILADDMGLGKTLQVIALLLSDHEEASREMVPANQRAALIVCPASLVYNWKHEFEKFAPELPVQMIAGAASERAAQIQSAGPDDVLITSYDLLKRDIEAYENYSFRTEIIDEAQYIKNHNTQAAKAVKEISAAFKLALTGTPVENRLSELWSIFDYLMPGFLYGYTRFREELETPIVQNEDEDARKRLQKMIAPFVLRRLKKDVLTDLPEKLEETMVAELSGEQQKLYDASVKRMMLMLDKQSEEEFRSAKITILAELTRLRQLCCDPALIYEDYKGESAKMELCIDRIRNAVEGGHKLLLFSQFTSMLDRLAERLTAEGIGYHMLTGATSKAKRAELVESFEEDDIPVFLISLKAGGTGLNLTAADMVIHYDPWWNLAVQNQATDRAHRIGQKHVVTVYKLVLKDTIEENIVKLQEKKKELADQILGGEDFGGGSLSREDLMELLKG